MDCQSRYGVTYLRYWFDEHNGRIYCLAEAPNKEAAIRVHREAQLFDVFVLRGSGETPFYVDP